jgi:predicted PurR-regulated permease PerM
VRCQLFCSDALPLRLIFGKKDNNVIWHWYAVDSNRLILSRWRIVSRHKLTNDTTHHRAFLALLIAISLAFVWLLTPFMAAIFWAIVIAILFAPLQRRLSLRLPRSPNLASLIMLLVIVLMVLLPMGFLVQSVAAEVIQLYKLVQAGQFGLGNQLEQVFDALPEFLRPWLERAGLADVEAIKSYVSRFAAQAVRVVGNQAINVGQNTFLFVLSLAIMLYLLFFLLRDGAVLSALVRRGLPLTTNQKEQFLDKLATVVRATIKGNVAVAAVQGALGGLIFWILDIPSAILWGTLMAILSLLPAVGASLVWAPVAVYFLATGVIGDAIILTLFGVLVIGLVDNVLRPILVGKDTRLPDYLVLISTLGGLTLFGLSGFIAGPLIAALFMVAWDLFMSMREDASGPSDQVEGVAGESKPKA